MSDWPQLPGASILYFYILSVPWSSAAHHQQQVQLLVTGTSFVYWHGKKCSISHWAMTVLLFNMQSMYKTSQNFHQGDFSFFPLVSEDGASSYSPNHSTVSLASCDVLDPGDDPLGKETGVKPLPTPFWTVFCNITNVGRGCKRGQLQGTSPPFTYSAVLNVRCQAIFFATWLVAVLSTNRLTESLGSHWTFQGRWCPCPHWTRAASQEFPWHDRGLPVCRVDTHFPALQHNHWLQRSDMKRPSRRNQDLFS